MLLKSVLNKKGPGMFSLWTIEALGLESLGSQGNKKPKISLLLHSELAIITLA